MTRKALVTGGAGFIGSNLVDLLVDNDWQALVVDDLSGGSMDNLAGARRRGKVGVHVTDIGAPELGEIMGRYSPEVVFHLAAQVKVSASVEDPVHDAMVNVVGLLNVLEAARRSGARKVVFASSGGAVYGPNAKLPVSERAAKSPSSPYGISKKVAEDYFRFFRQVHGLESTLLALSNVYGPRQDPGLEGGVVAIFSQAMQVGRTPTIYGDGSQTRDFVYVEDVADAFLRAADAGDGLFLNIGTGEETSITELFETMARVLGFGSRPKFADPRPGEVPRSVVDASRARRALGWEAWTSLADGLRRTLDSYA
ncbi:MAG TPA: GDP-mannose 4,6-dehydratase [Acidimicrobiia bacterium]|nr:GDP-mannose 4,6-dehydratase [Acidimicrobiia bacterium]